MCNHCPFVKHLADPLAQFAAEYMAKGVAVVGISSNDVANYPADSPEQMVREAEERGYQFPYLYDETQEVAKAYRAACTPDFFLFDRDRKLVYRGQFDDSRPDSGIPVTGADLRAAVDAVLAGKKAERTSSGPASAATSSGTPATSRIISGRLSRVASTRRTTRSASTAVDLYVYAGTGVFCCNVIASWRRTDSAVGGNHGFVRIGSTRARPSQSLLVCASLLHDRCELAAARRRLSHRNERSSSATNEGAGQRNDDAVPRRRRLRLPRRARASRPSSASRAATSRAGSSCSTPQQRIRTEISDRTSWPARWTSCEPGPASRPIRSCKFAANPEFKESFEPRQRQARARQPFGELHRRNDAGRAPEATRRIPRVPRLVRAAQHAALGRPAARAAAATERSARPPQSGSRSKSS